MDIKNLIPFGKKSLEMKRDEDNPFVMMQREMNRIFDTFMRDWLENASPEVHRSFTPRMDVSEDSRAFTLTAELPGIDDKDIDVSITRDTLNIKGEKKEAKEEKDKNYYYSERSFGSFSRSILLPREIDADKISASFKKGVLTIILPKSTAVIEDSKKINVKAE